MDALFSAIDLEVLSTMLVAYTPKIIAAAFIFIAFIILYNVFKKPLALAARKADLEQPIIQLLIYSLFKWTVLLLGLLMALKQLGIDVGAALAGLGVAGIAIGFAAQDSISNVIAGFIILIDKPFRVGDWIEVDEKFGKVHEITLRSTRIQTLNHTYVILPNKNVIDATINNHSKYGNTRLEIPLGIAYKEHIPTARAVILQAMEPIELLLKDPAPTLVVNALGDSSVDLTLRIWIDDAEKERPAYFAAIEAAKLALDEAGIEIPFPHLQLFVDDVKEKAAESLGKAFKF